MVDKGYDGVGFSMASITGSFECRDAGRVRTRVAVIAGVVVAGAFYVASQSGTDIDSGTIKRTDLLIAPIDLECRAAAVSDITGKVSYDRHVAGYTNKAIGSTVTIDRLTTTEAICADNADTEGSQPAVKIEIKPGQGSERYNKTDVAINTSKMVVIQAIVPGEKTMRTPVIHGNLFEGALSGITLGSISAKGACNLLLPDDQDPKCDYFDAVKNKRGEIDDQLKADAIRLALEKSRECINWPKVSEAIVKSYENEAVRLAGGDAEAAKSVTVTFVDQNGKPTAEPPKFKQALTKELEQAGRLDSSTTRGALDGLNAVCSTK